MTEQRGLHSLRGSCALVVCLTLLASGTGTFAEDPVDLFLSSIEKDTGLPADAKDLIRSTWANCQDCEPGEFLTQGLAMISEPFRKGLDAYDALQYDDCIQIMDALRSSPNPFVAVHSAAYEIKALVAKERLLDAGRRIEQLLDGQEIEEGVVGTYSYFAAEITFLHGFCLLSDLRYEQAQRRLLQVVQRYPESSLRLTLAAQQMLAELQTRQPEQIGEVCDLMTFAGRRLGQGDSGETVQTRQAYVIELLDKLIKDAEDKENSSNSSSGGSDSSGKKGAQQPSNPMQDSKLPGGSAKKGSLHAKRRANPGDMWGAMPPAERERILQALRDNFPSRYRRLVEQYYEELAKKP